MSTSAYKNYRIAAFAAMNTGKIIGCSANMQFKAKYNGAGFVFDNDGQIRNSVSVKAVHGKGKLGGFFYNNNGVIENCGFIGTARKGGEKDDAAFRDEALRIEPSTEVEKIYADLKLDTVWKNGKSNSLEPDLEANFVQLDCEDYIEISEPQQLLDLIDAVNDGDRKAAQGHYILTKDISLRGKKIDPIGVSEANPFTGIFNGNGKQVSNFTINAKDCDYAGFFGCTKNACVVNLKVDYILKAAKGNVSGGMVALCMNGSFENCAVYISIVPSRCCGGFAGKNSGDLINCYVCGKIRFPIIWWPLLLPLLLLLLLLAWFQGGGEEYVPEVIDPNQAPAKQESNVPPPPTGTSRISFELNQEVYISAETQVGEMGYVNPSRATMDAVVRICISDSELVRAGYDLAAAGVRSAEEQTAEGYDPDAAFTELYRSGRIQIGYAVDNCKLSPLPNGATLGVGEYEMIVMIDGYDPESNEKAIINTQVPISVFIV